MEPAQRRLERCIDRIALADLRIDRQCELMVDLTNARLPTLEAAHLLQLLVESRNLLCAHRDLFWRLNTPALMSLGVSTT